MRLSQTPEPTRGKLDLASFLDSMREFAASMTKNYDSTRMCYELSDHVVAALDADGAGVTVADRDGRLRYVIATDERAARLERVQEEYQRGPCMTAYLTDEEVKVEDVRADRAWPEYLRIADELGYHAVLGVPLRSDVAKLGALDVYNNSTRAWSDDDSAVVWAFADMATAYLVRTSELQEASRIADQLQRALESRILIEQAKGMIARRNDIDVDAAFALLRSHARSHQVPLTELAGEVVERRIEIG